LSERASERERERERESARAPRYYLPTLSVRDAESTTLLTPRETMLLGGHLRELRCVLFLLAGGHDP